MLCDITFRQNGRRMRRRQILASRLRLRLLAALLRRENQIPRRRALNVKSKHRYDARILQYGPWQLTRSIIIIIIIPM